MAPGDSCAASPGCGAAAPLDAAGGTTGGVGAEAAWAGAGTGSLGAAWVAGDGFTSEAADAVDGEGAAGAAADGEGATGVGAWGVVAATTTSPFIPGWKLQM